MARSAQTLLVSEIFDSIQGEGCKAGAPRTFLRLAGCNLRCGYCDTKYTWDWQQFDKKAETSRLPFESVLRKLQNSPGLVITGGEPLLQQTALARLLAQLPLELPVELETNGTIAPSPELLRRVDLWNVSPKLAAAGDPEEQRLRPAVLKRFRDSGRAWLKIVVEGRAEVAEAQGLVRSLAWPSERVMLQPQATERPRLLELSPTVSAWAREANYAFSPRLHLAIWGARRGV